ncbi:MULTISPECIES: DUF1573 domain-containing protein [Chitinophagaceae]
MKKVLVAFGLLLVGTNWIAAQTNTPVVAPPKDASKYVEIDDDDHDFGNILFKKPVDYVVHIQNISVDTLVLANVTVSCGCTIPEWKRGPYSPRDTFSIKINFNGYADGKFTRSLTLLFNDKKNSNIVKVLRFRGVGYEKLPVAVDNGQDGNDDDIDATARNRQEIPQKVKPKRAWQDVLAIR